MDITGSKIWQIAAGDTNRNYADLCLDWDVVLNGPGMEGPWPDCQDALLNKLKLTSKKISDIQRFAEDVKDGDLVVLRMGTTDVFGIGFIVGDYLYNEEFGDIDGWNLEHLRRVRWVWDYRKHQGTPQHFKTYSLKWGDTVQRLNAPAVENWIKSISISSAALNRPMVELPQSSRDISIKKISEYLFDKGISSAAISNVAEQLDELVRIATWYERTNTYPSEIETIAYLVIPLLRALGWIPQKMGVEWNNVDIALFKALPRVDKNLSVVLEAKRKSFSCLTAQLLAQSYATQSNRGTCKRLIVTDGIRYGVYCRNGGKFQDHPEAYLNITRLREDYPLLKCKGAKDAFLYLSADWNV